MYPVSVKATGVVAFNYCYQSITKRYDYVSVKATEVVAFN